MSDMMSKAEKILFGSKSFLDSTLHQERPLIRHSYKLINGTRVELWDSGVLYFQPVRHQQKDSILVSVGVHGNETAPIEIAEQLVKDILCHRVLVNQNLLIVLANPRAIKKQQRFIEENMNRLFQPDLPVSEQNNDEHQRASLLMKYSNRFFALGGDRKVHYDLHTAIRDSLYKKFAISPNRGDQAAIQPDFLFLQQCGIEAVLHTKKNSATYSAFTSRHCGAISFTLELGKVMPFGQNNLSNFSDVVEGLISFISNQGLPSDIEQKSSLKQFQIVDEVIKKTDGFRLCFAKGIANFSEFQTNDLLAIDGNYQYRVKESGERILFPNADVAIGQRALVIIRPKENESTE